MRAVYKCRLCGEKSVQIIACERTAIANVFSLTENETTKDNIGRYSMHKCKDGSVGLSDFLGFEKEQGK